MRFAAIHPPFRIPYRSIDVSAYDEQVGVNLQEGGRRGETNLLYALMA
jgi:hypothetical protein